jgi:hypothetical protein
MKKAISVFLAVLMVSVFACLAAIAEEPDTSTTFSGNIRLHYNKLYNNDSKEWNEDSFGLHFFELKAKKQVGAMGVFLNYRLGDVNNNYLYEGWISANLPCPMEGGKAGLKFGLVPVPFGIFANGLYYPKGIPYAKNWMWDYDYGVRLDGTCPLGDALGLDLAVAFLNNENGAGELSAFSASGCAPCVGDRNNISARLGVAAGAVGLKAGGSIQTGKLMRQDQAEDDSKLGIAGDISISPKMLPIPVTLMGEFINYSLADADTAKGNIIMGQLDITPIKGAGKLDAATLSLHFGMDTPTEGSSVTNLIAQLKLVMCKQFIIFAQVYGDKIQDVDDMMNKGLRIWFMYNF